ncbi:hypothetical protein BJ165DRAFT_1488333 [Panaeolus papilionaceus]|nr:hypothetical protein BJ165DRAFT_1488333 [Panaeolus papilionaceus]
MTIITTPSGRNLTLPAEICGLIIQYVEPLSKSDLRNFCRISRGFRTEAERHLYIHILLNGVRSVKLWARSVHKRPYLSAKTKRVVMYLPRQTGLEADDLGWVVKGLRTCSELEDLRVLEELDSRSPDGKRDHYGNSVHRWILNGHPFKLKSFTNEYFQNHLLNEFLGSQPDIEFLCLKGDDDAVIELDDIPLTSVHSMDGTSSAICAFTRNDNHHKRQLQHLQFEFRVFSRSDLAVWRHLRPHANTLQSLSILETGNSKWGHSFHMLPIQVYEQLPDLRHLRILSTRVHVCDTSAHFLYLDPHT